jgi:gamma-glutamyltranspeptidase/glutathione hydrolase
MTFRLLLCLVAWIAVPAAAQVATPVLPREAAVASANAQATQAGLEVLRAGGNAFDAAVAVSATLGLVEPESSGLGGGGFFLLHLAGENRDVFVDARETAPSAATRDMFLGADGEPVRGLSVNGALAAAIPGLPAALDHVSRNYGRLPLARALGPAARLAREGWRFDAKNAAMLGYRLEYLSSNAGASALLLRGGKAPVVGSRMRNPDYARTLKLLGEQGAAGFYRGAFAARLVDGVRAAGGIWTLDDLAKYRVVEREPIRFTHRGYAIVTAPPPSAGGAMLAQVFQVLDGYDFAPMGRVDRAHLLVEAMRRSYRDRAIYFGDPDFVKVPLDLLQSPQYAAGLRASINPARATPSDLLPGIVATPVRPQTTHFSIIDRDGNLAAVTQTVNLPFGNGLVVAGSGFLLNNEMDDFSAKAGVPNAFGLVGEDANAIAPGKRPLSSMTPSILRGTERVAVLGTPGGSRITSMVLLATIALMDGATPQEAVALPRFHHQYLPDVISAEQGAFNADEQKALEQRGHTVAAGERTWGNMYIASWDLRSGAVATGADPRWEGEGRGASAGDIHR